MAETSSGHEGGADASPAPGRPSRERYKSRRDRLIRAPLLDRFGLVLVLVLLTIAVQGLIDVRGSVLARLFTHAITGLALIAAVRASGSRRRWRRAVDVLVVIVVLLSLLMLWRRRADGSFAVPPETTWLLAAALTPVLIARRVLQHTVVTIQTIMGSVAAYLQLAVAYAFLFQTIDAYTPTPFFGEEVSTTTYMYFSLVTISTVGFGDVAAVTDLGRMAAASEAVVGQVYLVTFVALIVSRFAAGMPRGSAGAAVTPRTGPVPRTLFEALDSSRSQQPPPERDDDEDDEDEGRDEDRASGRP